MLFQCIRSAIKDWKITCKGQKGEYELLQIAHRLEKGLLIENPRPMWGWGKAERSAELIRTVNDLFSLETGGSVLRAYLNTKENSMYEKDREQLTWFMNKYLSELDKGKGGTICYKWNPLSVEDVNVVERLFNTRHSIRSFSDKDVSESLLLKAIGLALRCPSACNRQPFRVYVIDNSTKQSIVKDDSIQGNKFLFVTGDITAFNVGEFNDWIVSPSIFVGYLTLSLHLYGIGSCVMRKDLVRDTSYNEAIKTTCGIPEEEKLIVELAIGNYKKDNVVPYSNRHDAKEITSFVRK